MTTEKKSRLGRGLDALLPGVNPELAPTLALAEVPIGAIEENPYQPRKNFDEDDLSSLSESIRTLGVLQPLVVRQCGDRFQLIAGERRLRAARTAGLPAVPVRIVDFNDQETVEAALVENIHRSDLNAIEKAQGFKEYLDRFHMTHEQLAQRLSLARPTITNLVALLELPTEIQDAVRRGQVTLGHAKILKGVTDREKQLQVCKDIIARGLSVHATEAMLKQPSPEAVKSESRNGSHSSPEPIEKTAHVQGIEDELRQKLSTKIDIKLREKDKGQIVLTFESNDDFERIVETLRR